MGVPHGCHDALEPGKEHGSSKMDCLVRLRVVTLRRLARTQNGQECRGYLELHQLRYGQRPILEVETALKRIAEVLGAMTSKVQDRGRPDVLEHLATAGDLRHLGRWRHETLHCARFNDSHRKGRPLVWAVHGHKECFCFGTTHRLGRLPSMKERRD
jgi:hypothetical protein